jgi:hypothetical protein
MPVKTETDQDQNTNQTEGESHDNAKLSSRALRPHRRRQSPLA